MKVCSLAQVAVCAALVGFAPLTAAHAAPLDDNSLAPAWSAASSAEKDAWIAAFKFEKDDADRAGIAACLDKMTAWAALSTNKLSGVTSMCETAVARGGM